MFKDSKTIVPYDDIDTEIIDLCKAMNSIDGIETVSSCVGHGERPCQIWFKCETPDVINRIIFYCFNHEMVWDIRHDCGDPDRSWTDLHYILTTGSICDMNLIIPLVNNLCKKIQKYLDGYYGEESFEPCCTWFEKYHHSNRSD